MKFARLYSRRFVIVALLLLLTTTACSLFTGSETGSGGVDLTQPAPMCTPPACALGETLECPDGNCPGGCGYICTIAVTATDPELGVAPTDWAGLESWLANAWEIRADPAAVRAGLRASGWLEGYNNWTGADLNGDLRDEWIVSLVSPDPAAIVGSGRLGNLWVIGTDGVVYRAYETFSADNLEQIAPAISGVLDLTNDGKPELVTNQVICGAHTCYGNYRVISTIRGGYSNLVSNPATVEGATADVVSISYSDVSFNDFEMDGLVDMAVHGGALGSAGAGVTQTYTEVWEWDGTAVSLQNRIYDSSDYRHHYVYEGNRHMAAGKNQEAVFYYEEAINNGDLLTPPGVSDIGEVYAAIAQFSAFRLILIDELQGNAGQAATRLAWLERTYPGTAVTQGAGRLVREWAGAEGLGSLCNSIENELNDIAQPIGPLTDEMGYGNPSLTADDLCP